MMAPPPFYVVTDDARAACLTLFARDPEFKPAFVTLVTDAAALNAMPTKALVFAFWTEKEGMLAVLWREQRRRFNVDGARILDMIAAWRAEIWRDAHHAAPAAAPAMPAQAITAPAAPASPQPKQTRWYS